MEFVVHAQSVFPGLLHVPLLEIVRDSFFLFLPIRIEHGQLVGKRLERFLGFAVQENQFFVHGERQLNG